MKKIAFFKKGAACFALAFAAVLGLAIMCIRDRDWEQPVVDMAVLGVMGGALVSTFSMTGMLCFALASLFMLLRMRRGMRRVLIRVCLLYTSRCV